MPSYRVVIAVTVVIDPLPGVAPPDVLPTAERMLARIIGVALLVTGVGVGGTALLRGRRDQESGKTTSEQL